MLKIMVNVVFSYVVAAVLINSIYGQWMRLYEEL